MVYRVPISDTEHMNPTYITLSDGRTARVLADNGDSYTVLVARFSQAGLKPRIETVPKS